MKEIDVLWFVEHIAREMDVACAVKCLSEHRYGIDVKIRHIYLHANQAMKEHAPLVVVHPFFYYVSGALATEDFVKAWPHSAHFNLAWEEIFYKAHLKVKAPADEFTKKTVIHHAWGNFFKKYLLENGVPSEHIFLNGNPAYQLYKSPYNKYYKQRDWLAHKYGLDPSLKWIFVPENYRWAFMSDRKINTLVDKGGNLEEILNLRKFCKDSLPHLLQWCNKAANNKNIKIIFRPRPATMLKQIEELFRRHVDRPMDNLHFIKGESVREWILASDVVISSYSTSLIEAAVANKPIYMAEPIPIPDSLYCDWYSYVPRIRSGSEFEDACLRENNNDVSKLRSWVQDEMLANGDPIEKLADFICSLVKRGGTSNSGTNKTRHFNSNSLMMRAKCHFRECLKIFSKRKNFFNVATHENDLFTEEDVQKRVKEWRRILIR
tara:strand:- start:1244 stop:2548 length:1305 start_codon:yes stop_codon:yes gene_type:complete